MSNTPPAADPIYEKLHISPFNPCQADFIINSARTILLQEKEILVRQLMRRAEHNISSVIFDPRKWADAGNYYDKFSGNFQRFFSKHSLPVSDATGALGINGENKPRGVIIARVPGIRIKNVETELALCILGIEKSDNSTFRLDTRFGINKPIRQGQIFASLEPTQELDVSGLTDYFVYELAKFQEPQSVVYKISALMAEYGIYIT